MRRNRGVQNLLDLTLGPGRHAAAFGIDRRLDGIDLRQMGPLWLARDDHDATEIGTSTRIGLSREADRPLRFYLRGDPFISGPKTLHR